MTLKKFKLGKREANGLCRVIALRDFGAVAKGSVGGFVEKENNLSHDGTAWVYGDAHVSGNARVYGNARVADVACVSDDAWVYGDAHVSGNAGVYGNARVADNAWVYGNARVADDAWVYGDAGVSGRFDVTCEIDFELPRITLDTTAKAKALRDFLVKLDKKRGKQKKERE